MTYLTWTEDNLLRQVSYQRQREDKPAHRLALKFFNTSLRSAFASKDVRTAYNILYQYRSVAEELIRTKELFLTELVFGYFKYYGQLFDSGGLGFILETSLGAALLLRRWRKGAWRTAAAARLAAA